MSGITFDAGGLIALDRNDRRVIALLARAADLDMRVTVPATALAQAIRNPARQARLSRLIRQASTDLVPLNGPDATAVGLLLAETATADVSDAHRCDLRSKDGAGCCYERSRRYQANRSESAGGRGLRTPAILADARSSTSPNAPSGQRVATSTSRFSSVDRKL
jgi:hypothetical protein